MLNPLKALGILILLLACKRTFKEKRDVLPKTKTRIELNLYLLLKVESS